MDAYFSALSLARAIRKKELSPVEAVEHYLARVDARNPALNALIWRRDDALRAEAKAAEAAVMRGDELAPFHGVPIPIKDLTEALGEPTTHGSRIAKAKIGRFDASAVARLRRAGFLFMGRTNSPEFGTLPVTENALYGATRNPWNPAYTPGGSSGGAAAAVASGMAPVAHASDGGGSIRIPASCCGLVGLKASRARIPKGPLISEPLLGFPTDGAVSVDVADTAALLDVLAWRDLDAWYSVPEPERPFLDEVGRAPGKLRIGFTTHGPVASPVDPDAVEALTRAATLLSELGHDVFEVTAPWPWDGELLKRDFITIWATASAAYVEFQDLSELEPINAGLKALCDKLGAADFIGANMRMQMFSRRVVARWRSEFDLLLTPTLAMPPPKIGWLFETGETDPVRLLERCTAMVPYCGWANVTGQPGISLPVHVNAAGLPIGVQLVGAPFGEATLLRVAKQMEDALDWASSLPR